MSDISIKMDDARFNYRLVFVFSDEDRVKFLVHTIKGFNFWLFPGGRAKVLESSTEGVLREIREEIECDVSQEDLNLIAVSENFFEFKGMKNHEVSMFYHADIRETDNLLNENEDFFGKEGEKYIYKWVSIEELKEMNLQPAFAKDLAENIQKNDLNIKHIVLNEMKNNGK